MRHEDKVKAFEHVLEAYSSGLPFEDYIKSCLQGTIIVKSETETNVANGENVDSESSEDSFSDAISDETRVAIATKHCEPDCSQCREAAAICEAAVTEVPETISEETSEASASGAVTGETVATEMTNRPPVCHFSWLLKDCTVVDCRKTHPTICGDPKCWDLNQDLPRWKAIGCKNFHGRMKSTRPKPRTTKKSKANPQKSRTFHGSRPQTMGPVGLPAPWCQTWNQPKWDQEDQVGKDKAAWTVPTRGGANQWGKGMMMPYNVVTRGPSPVKPSQFELELLALVNQIFA